MNQATLEPCGDGRFRIDGDLDCNTVKQLLDSDDKLFSQNQRRIEIDLSAVGRTTSAGLVLMLEWLRQAQARNFTIRFSHIPAQMFSMAKVSQLETILELESQESED